MNFKTRKKTRRLERKVARRLQRKTHAVIAKFAGRVFELVKSMLVSGTSVSSSRAYRCARDNDVYIAE